MRFAHLALAAAGAAAVLSVATVATPLGATAPRLVPSSMTAEKYFACPTGYTFQVSGTSARCYLAGTSSTADIACGVGYVKTIDQFNGGRDGCQHKLNNTVGNYTCPSGFSPKVQAGPDVCLKAASPSIIAPSVEKWL